MKLSLWIVASACVTLGTAPLVLFFDETAYTNAGDEATISRLSQRVAWRYPPYRWAVCYLLGLLTGHLFTTRPCPVPLPVWLTLALFVALPYFVALGAMIAGLRGGLPLSAGRAAGLAPVVAALVIGADDGAELLHQTGP